MDLKPIRGGFLRPFGCGWFVREFLLGNGPGGSKKIDRNLGATQTDINYEYKEALAKATARDRAERKQKREEAAESRKAEQPSLFKL